MTSQLYLWRSFATLLLLVASAASQRQMSGPPRYRVRDRLSRERQGLEQFQNQVNQTLGQLRDLVEHFKQVVVAHPGQVPEACSQLPAQFQQMYNDVTFIKARTETIGLELRSRVDNLWVHAGQEFARIQQQLDALLEDSDSVPRAVNVLVSLNQNLQSDSSPRTLVFDRVTNNLADGYDEHSGHFRCPMSGVYTFNVGLSVAQGTGVEVSLLHNGSTLLHWALSEPGQLYSAGLSIQCREGEGVWLEITHPESSTPVQLNSDCYLSGALVSSLQ